MNVKNFYEIIKNAEENHEDGNDIRVIGIRFEELERKVGDICNNSKHNLDRENEDDMPEFGTEEYEEMFELDGTSAFDVDYLVEDLERSARNNPDANMSSYYYGKHCYIVGGKYTTNESDAIDYGEVVIESAKVLEVIY